jgi:hypothetical protein
LVFANEEIGSSENRHRDRFFRGSGSRCARTPKSTRQERGEEEEEKREREKRARAVLLGLLNTPPTTVASELSLFACIVSSRRCLMRR